MVRNKYTGLLLSPFLGHEFIRQIFFQIMEECGVRTYMPEYAAASAKTVREIMQEAIEKADFIIADVTGSNPNVMYELGLARGFKKTVFLIMKEGNTDVPFYIQGDLFYIYDQSKPEQLKIVFKSWINRFIEKEKMGDQGHD